ncbi:hypothetical protein AGMMS49983_02940 [Clostridia bacterium]|nr:hypothetical protein AGMMS49983_02940 [Clostridia bacterium]
MNSEHKENKLNKGLLVFWAYVVIICATGIIVFVLYTAFSRKDYFDANETGDRIIVVLISVSLFVLLMCILHIKVLKPIYMIEIKLRDLYGDIVTQRGNSLHIDIGKIDYNEMLEMVIVNHRDSRNRELTANFLRQKAELAGLQSQINPHFLFNTLDSIRGLAYTEGVEDVADMIGALSSLFRSNIQKKDTLVSLSDEIATVEAYIMIQGFRFKNRFAFEKKISIDQDGLKKSKILNFTLQPLIENAIYHGLESRIEEGKIVLSAYQTSSRLILRVSDNGSGISPELLADITNRIDSLSESEIGQLDDIKESHTGIGLININQRIKLQFGNEYGLRVASTVGVGTQIEVILPYILEEESYSKDAHVKFA